MVSYEFQGKTTAEAIQKASKELNIPAEEMDIEIIEPGSAGIFGLVGGKKAIIKVFIEPEEDDQDSDEEMGEIEEEIPEKVAPEIVAASEDTLNRAKEILANVLRLMPIEANLTAEIKNGDIILNIEGDKSGLLIGRKGKTLDALQFIINRAINKKSDKKSRVIVDSENYRQRRNESLVQIALKMGDKARRIKKPVTTHLLNAHDRRVFHITLRDDERLDVKSRGDGLLKKIVIIPKK